jgi:DNA (cytosine-5)-methyltransferase 1
MLEVLELFGGIGACSKALERLNIPYHIADYVEIDKYAVKSFNAIHNTDFKPQDICNWDKDKKVDLIMHGSPCQDFSLVGKQAGGDKDSGTRSSLMYETIRIVEKLKPKYVVWENVKNLTSKKHIHNFNAYLETLEQLGYTNYYQVLNAKDYGIPQNRERIFTISIKKDLEQTFTFPLKQELNFNLKDMLEENADNKYNLKSVKHFFINNSFNMEAVGNGFRFEPHIKKNAYISKTITTRSGGRMDDNFILDINCNKRTFKFDLTNTDLDLYNNEPIRKLTPKECWRLMGFDDEDFNKAAQVNSNTQLYKQAGNSIVVNVLEAIFKNLLREYIKPEIIYIED